MLKAVHIEPLILLSFFAHRTLSYISETCLSDLPGTSEESIRLQMQTSINAFHLFLNNG